MVAAQVRSTRTITLTVSAIVLSVLNALGPADTSAEETSNPTFQFHDALERAQAMPRLHSLLVNWNNQLVLEHYFNGQDRTRLANVKSVSKSWISALVGIAIGQGYIKGINQPISDYFGDLLSREDDLLKGEITIGNLLTMQSGLETTSNRNYGAWVQSGNWIDYALSQPLELRPGTAMEYSTGNTHLLSAILTKATGVSTLEFARQTLSDALGFRLAPWPRGPQGIYFGGNDMEMTPRQMIKFGELYLNHGQINERQVIPANWIDTSLQPHTESTRERGRSYGYGWWIRNMAGFNTSYAWGYGGQFILLVPELDLIIVTTSSSNPGLDRRSHTRRVYDLVEYSIIVPASRDIRKWRNPELTPLSSSNTRLGAPQLDP